MMLAQENNGQVLSSVTAEQFLSERRIGYLRTRREGAAKGTRKLERTRTGTLTLTPPPQLAESRTEEPFFKEQNLSALERKRFEMEMGTGGDHDAIYTFTLPVLVPQLLAWTKLLARVRQGELQP